GPGGGAVTGTGPPGAGGTWPRRGGVVRGGGAGIAAAAQIVPMVVGAFAVASPRPGFSPAPAAPPAPRSLYDTQRVSSSWLTAAAATPTAADMAASSSPPSNTAAGRVTAASGPRRA